MLTIKKGIKPHFDLRNQDVYGNDDYFTLPYRKGKVRHLTSSKQQIPRIDIYINADTLKVFTLHCWSSVKSHFTINMFESDYASEVDINAKEILAEYFKEDEDFFNKICEKNTTARLNEE